jgi:hypothetical protein
MRAGVRIPRNGGAVCEIQPTLAWPPAASPPPAKHAVTPAGQAHLIWAAAAPIAAMAEAPLSTVAPSTATTRQPSPSPQPLSRSASFACGPLTYLHHRHRHRHRHTPPHAATRHRHRHRHSHTPHAATRHTPPHATAIATATASPTCQRACHPRPAVARASRRVDGWLLSQLSRHGVCIICVLPCALRGAWRTRSSLRLPAPAWDGRRARSRPGLGRTCTNGGGCESVHSDDNVPSTTCTPTKTRYWAAVGADP